MTRFMSEDTILPSFRTLCRGCLRSPISELTLGMLHFLPSVDQKNDIKLKSLGEKKLHKKPKCLGICEQNENLPACDAELDAVQGHIVQIGNGTDKKPAQPVANMGRKRSQQPHVINCNSVTELLKCLLLFRGGIP